MRTDRPGAPSQEEIRAFITASRWIFARTMPQMPHEYVLRRESPDESVFERFIVLIRETGYRQEYDGQEYVYLNVDGYRYWTMGSPLPETILINRAALEPVRADVTPCS